MKPINVLLVEDNPQDALLVQEALEETASAHFALTHVERLEEAFRRFQQEGFEVVLLDLTLPDSHGLDTLKRFSAHHVHVPIVVLTGLDDDAMGIEALHAGAQDYLIKGEIDAKSLCRSLRYAMERKRLEELLATEKERLNVTLRLEQELLTSQKLDSIGVLAGGIAHDFNNILTAIMGNLCLAKLAVSPSEELYKRLSEAEKASQRAKGLTHQLLTFAKGGMPVKKTIFVEGVVREAARFALYGSNVRPEFSIWENLCPVDVDEGLMNQVVHNLVINAKQAMPGGGTLRIGGENVSHIFQETKDLPLPPGQYVHITFADEGVGISKEHLPRIFDPFFTTKPKGSGLGLATSYSIVKKHGGHITVRSELGQGSVFSIYLLASSEAVVEKEGERGALLKDYRRILIMDDEEVIRNVLGSMLTNLGYLVESACEGAQAIALYKRNFEAGIPFDAVMIDLTIQGGIGGKEVLQELRKVDPQAKAIVSSGYATDAVMANYEEYGFKGVLTKPYRIGELAEVLAQLLND